MLFDTYFCELMRLRTAGVGGDMRAKGKLMGDSVCLWCQT